MIKNKQKQKSWLDDTKHQLWLSGGLSALLFLGYFIIFSHIYPFGKATSLTADSGQQYVRFLIWARDAIFKNHDFTYTLYKGYGGEMYSTWAYYLISPFNILLLFMTNKLMPFGITIVTTLKIASGAIALNWYLLKSRLLQLTHTRFAFVLSMGYSLSAWVLSNQLNFIWLDVLWAFPLFILFIEQMFDHKKFIYFPFILIVFAMLVINYYMAYISGLFSIFYVVMYLWAVDKNHKIKHFFQYIVNGLFGVLLSCFITIPTFYQLMSGKMNTGDRQSLAQIIGKGISIPQFYNLLARNNMGFSGIKDLASNQAEIYCGMLIAILAFAYLFSEQESVKAVRIRCMYIVLFFILIVPMFWAPANILWHAGAAPTWYNDRFMFIWGFLAVSCAGLAWDKITSMKWWSITLASVLITGMCLFGLAILNKPKVTLQLPDIITSVMFALTYMAILICIAYIKSDCGSLILKVIICLTFISELGINVYLTNQKFTYVQEYQVYNPIYYFKQFPKKLKLNSGQNFDRVGRTNTATFNDALNNGIPDGYSFNSNTDGPTRAWNFGTGQMGDDNIMSKVVTDLISDNIIGYKYFLSLKPELTSKQRNLIGTNRYTQKRVLNNPLWVEKMNVHAKPDYQDVYKMKHALPLGFMTSRQVLKNQMTNSWSFNLNNFMNEMAGTDTHYIYQTPTTAKLHNLVKVPNTNGNRIYRKISPKREAYMTIKFKVPTNDTYYFMLPPNDAKYSYRIANEYQDFNIMQNVYAHNLCTELASHDKGKIVRIKITQNRLQDNWTVMSIYHFDDRKIAGAFKKLQKQPLKLTEIGHNKLKGRINVKVPGTLMITIPNIKGWTAKVDGETAPIHSALSTWIGINLDQGKHNIKIEYHEPYLKLGLLISLITLLILFIYFKLNQRKSAR